MLKYKYYFYDIEENQDNITIFFNNKLIKTLNKNEKFVINQYIIELYFDDLVLYYNFIKDEIKKFHEKRFNVLSEKFSTNVIFYGIKNNINLRFQYLMGEISNIFTFNSNKTQDEIKELLSEMLFYIYYRYMYVYPLISFQSIKMRLPNELIILDNTKLIEKIYKLFFEKLDNEENVNILKYFRNLVEIFGFQLSEIINFSKLNIEKYLKKIFNEIK